MNRRTYLSAIGRCLAGTVLAGCAELSPVGGDGTLYPGGTVVVENTGDTPVRVTVTANPDKYDASLDTTVEGGETLVNREFVIADPGDIVTLTARLGEAGERIHFQFLPAGDADGTTPEVAHLTFENAVEASASWTATAGT